MASTYQPPAPLRVACPACGAAVHPIAGRCRHCRVDLTRRVDAPAPAPAATAAASKRPRAAFIAALVVALAIAAVAVPLGLG